MVAVKNTTVFPHIRLSHSDKQGREFGVLTLKCAYDIDEDGRCVISKDQEPFNFSDACYEEVNTSSLQYPSDMAAYKPKTDFVLNAVAFAPKGVETNRFDCGAAFFHNGRPMADKTLRIYGKRYWRPLWKRRLNEQEQAEWKQHRQDFSHWKLTEAEQVESLPIRYEYAYGGSIIKGADEAGNEIVDACHYNPLGMGLLDTDWSDHIRQQPAAQIEETDHPITEPFSVYKPAGFGAIPAHWLPRRPLGGTYDKNWFDNIRPKWPPDYDTRFNNSAPEDQQLALIHSGNIAIELKNLRPDAARLKLVLDCPKIAFSYATEKGVESYIPNIDTILVDVAEADIFDCRVLLTLRAPFDLFGTEAILITKHSDDNAGYAKLEPVPAPEIFAVPSNRLEKPE